MGRRNQSWIGLSIIVAAGLCHGFSSPVAVALTAALRSDPPIVEAEEPADPPASPDEGPTPPPAEPELKPTADAKASKPKETRPRISLPFKDGFKPAKDPALKKANVEVEIDPGKPKAEADDVVLDGAPPSLPPAEIPAPGVFPVDTEVMKVQAAAEKAAKQDTGPVPVAAENPGAAVPQGVPGDAKSFVLPADRLQIGKQSVGLSIDVVAPEVWNLNQICDLKIVIKNNGVIDALGVSVRDELPDGLTFVSSQPEAQPIGSLLTWSLGVVPAGSDRTITLKVKPVKTGSFDHAATVTMLAGGKSRTIIREPKLKVEQTATTGKILLGQPAHFKIVISNPGDGPVRNVAVRAKLSSGLKHELAATDQILEQKIDVIPAGQRVVLNTLEADTKQGGEQTCEVSVESPDVVEGGPDARIKTSVTVIEPKLTMKVQGPDKRWTDMVATYEIDLDNPGTSPAKNVVLQATLPSGGNIYRAVPAGAKFDPKTRKLIWNKSQLDPGEKMTVTFKLQMGGIGLYQVAAEAKADGGLLAKDTISTNVSGLADVDINITEDRRAVDVGETTVYKIRIVNRGTKEATKILVSAKLPETVEPRQTSGTEDPGSFNAKTDRKFVFPQIDRLGPGKQIELEIQVEAVKPGDAICRVYLTHDEITEQLEDLAVFKVEKVRR